MVVHSCIYLQPFFMWPGDVSSHLQTPLSTCYSTVQYLYTFIHNTHSSNSSFHSLQWSTLWRVSWWPNQRKGGSNWKDQNSCVYRKARRNADKTKTQYKCIKVDSNMCSAAVWVNDQALMVEKPNHEHNHSPPLQMLAWYVLGLFSVQSLQHVFHL